ncbi:uncharacterized protein [Ptychodera flava]|uniref:uncharacterized protein n=1 Tax=Ptychodera flava TaxID=63121 RepID=UPI00396A30B2
MSETVVWLVGAGAHAVEYAKVLSDMGVKFEVIGRGAESAAKFQEKTGHPVHVGGVEPFLAANPIRSKKNTSINAIVTVSIPSLASCTIKLIKHGVNRILLEKPGGRNSEEISEVQKEAEAVIAQGRDLKIRMAYNRRFYASVRKARELANEDGGITSFVFEFTEWSHIIAGLSHPDSVKQSWFLGNSHVLDLAFFLGGRPKDLHCHHAGQGEVFWHPQASLWVGSGITETNALFSYHANWAAPGRWWLEILTRKNRYIFRPLEKLHVTRLGSVKVEEIEIDDSLDKKFKPGLWLQTKTFLSNPDDGDLLPLSGQLHHVQKFYEPMRGTEMTKLPSILIVGAGNIGSRHLQSLAGLDIAVDIVVVEPVEACRARAKAIYDGEAKANTRTKVVYLESLDEVNTGRLFNVAIIATTSSVRRQVVTSVLDHCKVTFMILEKVLFQTSEDHEKVLSLLSDAGVKGYVNSQWITFPLGKYLKEKLPQGPVNFHVHGQGWGMCCNGLHMVTLANFLNDSKTIIFDGSQLQPGFESSKRQGFVEVFGTLKGQIKSNRGTADLSIVCTRGPMTEGRIMQISNEHANVFWNEQTGTLFGSFAANNWEWERKDFPSPMVSRWTHLMVKQMLETGTCDLPKYEDIYQMSMALNGVFIDHLAKAGHEGAKNGVCPVT